MMIDKIRAMKEAQPFRPFVIYFTDGDEIEVPSGEFIGASPSGRKFAVWKENAFHIFEVSMVKDIEAKIATDRRKRRSS